MFNVFKRPFHQESLDSWCKMLDDIAKVAILALPVILYSEKGIGYKLINSLFLVISVYICLMVSDLTRKNKSKLITER